MSPRDRIILALPWKQANSTEPNQRKAEQYHLTSHMEPSCSQMFLIYMWVACHY